MEVHVLPPEVGQLATPHARVQCDDHERTVAKRKRSQEPFLLCVRKDPDPRVVLLEELHPAERIALGLGGLGLHRAVERHFEERQVAVRAGRR